MKTVLNLNDAVKVKLKKRGVKIMTRMERDLLPKRMWREYSQGQILKMKLWEAFQLFGRDILMGDEAPIETDIEIVNE